MNNPQVIQSLDRSGYGLNAQWCDDFHHSLHSFVTGEKQGYYADYGEPDQVEKAFRDGFVFSGIYSEFLHKTRGSDNREYGTHQLVVFIQDHDQVGNRPKSDRPTTYAGMDATMAMAAATMLSPFVPMLFMGEEIGSTTPFWFFIDTDDDAFARAVDHGRKAEFNYLDWSGEYVPPSYPGAFTESKINWDYLLQETGKKTLKKYRELITLRKRLGLGGRRVDRAKLDGGLLKVRYGNTDLGDVECLINLSRNEILAEIQFKDVVFTERAKIWEKSLLILPWGIAVLVSGN